MVASVSGLVDPTDLSPGKHLVDGNTLSTILKASSSGIGGLTALAGGGSVGATQINAYITEFTTVASANDSAIAPPALSGTEIEVINSGASNLRLYCQTSNANNPNAAGSPQADTIIPLAGGAGVGFITIAAGAVGVLSCATLGRWKSQNQ